MLEQGSGEKTAFSTRYGHFEWLVLSFGVANGPGRFQKRVNRVLAAHIDKFVIVYMDDILIFSHTLEEHIEHLKIVLTALSEADLILTSRSVDFSKQKLDSLAIFSLVTAHAQTPAISKRFSIGQPLAPSQMYVASTTLPIIIDAISKNSLRSHSH